MKPISKLAAVSLAAFVVLVLAACSKSKNGSNNASAPQTCSMNQFGQLVYPNGQTCQTGQMICPSNGVYTNQYGQQQACTPGQIINNGAYYPSPGGYPYTPYPVNQIRSCSDYFYVYGTQYVPVILNNQYMCLRYDLLQPYTYNTNYYAYGWDYYYAYPPYTGPGCSTEINIGFGFGEVGFCF